MVIVLRTVQFRSLENIEGASVASKLVCHSGECELLANVRIITASFDEHWLAPATPALPCHELREQRHQPRVLREGETVNNRYKVVMCQHRLCKDILHFIVIILDTKTGWVVVNEW